MKGYKEDIAMMNDEAFYKEPSSHGVKALAVATGITLFSPAADMQGINVFHALGQEVRMEQLYDSYPDTPVVAKKQDIDQVLPSEIKGRMEKLTRLQNNWDGYGASSVNRQVVKNATTFLKTLQNNGLKLPSSDDVYATPYGSIVIELYNNYGLVSLEIGNQQVGYFTDYRGRSNWGSEGIETDFKSIPKILMSHLTA